MSKKAQKQEVVVIKQKKSLIVTIVILLLVVFMVSGLIKNGNPFGLLFGGDNKVTTLTRTEIVEVLEISELNTVEFMYNSIVPAYADNGEDIKYYVAYEGIIKAGIDFEDLDFEIDDKKHVIYMTLPEVQIFDDYINVETLDFIFEKEKYETETIFQEAYALSCEDLREKGSSDGNIKVYAEQNSKRVVEGLLRPLIDSKKTKYEVCWMNEGVEDEK